MNIPRMSPVKAVFICINSMIGAGIFINTKPLTMLAGPFGFLAYFIGACILFPLIFCIAELANMHPVAGGLYVYPRTYLGPWLGFLGGWSYFVGKTMSVAILMHKFVEFFIARIPQLQSVPAIIFDIFMLFLIVALNSGGVSIGGRIQYFITALKVIPLVSVFVIGFFYFDVAAFYYDLVASDAIASLPIALFALSGFEAICAVSNMVDRSKRSLKWVIMTSFCTVAAINIIFQMSAYAILGSTLTTTSEPILSIGLLTFLQYPFIASALNGAVFAAIIGSCFALLTSNCWNLHTIAKQGNLPFQNALTRINRFNAPWVSLLIEVSLGCTVLAVTLNQIPLQNMAVLSQQTAFFLCACAAFRAVQLKATKNIALWVPMLAMIACGSIMGICVYRLIMLGVSVPFVVLFCTGLVAALVKHYFLPKCQ